MKTTKNTKKTVLKKNKSSVKHLSSSNTKDHKISMLTSSQHRSAHTHIDENLYICINDVTLKRKYLLQSLKSSLVLQEEQDKIVEIRDAKLQTLNDIKREMESLNLKYQNLKKLLPNVKNMISYTEKELNELDTQIDFLKKEVRVKNKEIELDRVAVEDLNAGMKFSKNRKYEQTKEGEAMLSKEGVVISSKKKSMTKLERIQNNLKLIESKLKNI